MNIDLRILDHLLTCFELDSVLAEKHDAVKNQRFADAVTILDRQRELEKKLMTKEELRQLRDELHRLSQTNQTEQP